MEEETEENGEWESARVLFGRLTGIDKKGESITLEFKDDNNQWVSENFSTDGWTKEDYERLRQHLGRDINLTVEDHNVLRWDSD